LHKQTNKKKEPPKNKKNTHTIVAPLHSSTSLKMCFLNVGGLKNKEDSKLEDLFFINKINKYDIVFLAETHIGYESNIHRVGTFYFYQICRPIVLLF
jgi:hypothetical protein